MARILEATNAVLQTTVSDVTVSHLGTCGRFEECQIGGERFNLLTNCPKARTCTLILRGGADQFLAEVERSLHDALMVTRRTLKSQKMVAGGGAVEMDLSRILLKHAKSIPGRAQLVFAAYAYALESLPRQLCENAGFVDVIDTLTQLRKLHHEGHTWMGVDVENEGVADMQELMVWEPALVKRNMIAAATEAACMILSVDFTVRNHKASDTMQSALPGQH